MVLDADVLLRVRDRAALAAALEAFAALDRQDWRAQGRDADYDRLLAEGYDPAPPLRRHTDGSVAIFTGLSFAGGAGGAGGAADFAIRCWLHACFGDRLRQIHDDPRGVFLFPDVSATRSQTYEGIVEELAGVGRFIDPSPPTMEEHRAWGAPAAHDAGRPSDLATLGEALLGAPVEVHEARERHATRMVRMSAHQLARRH